MGGHTVFNGRLNGATWNECGFANSDRVIDESMMDGSQVSEEGAEPLLSPTGVIPISFSFSFDQVNEEARMPITSLSTV